MSGILITTPEEYRKRKANHHWKDLTGKQIGFLQVISFAGIFQDKVGCKHSHWMCRCDCCSKIKMMCSHNMNRRYACGCRQNKYVKGLDNNNLIDLTGKKIGKIKVIRYHHFDESLKTSRNFWECLCDCGKTVIISSGILQKAERCNNKTSCGCGIIGQENVNFKDLTGKTFGPLTILGYSDFRRGKNNRTRNYWVCKCNECGSTKIISGSRLNSKNKNACGCRIHKHGPGLSTWTGSNLISGRYLNAISRGAKSRELCWEVDKFYLDDLFLKQNEKCALSGVPISLSEWEEDGTHIKMTASLDRIDSSLGYTKENTQFVHKDINRMKQDFDEKRFIELCKLVAKYNK